jgi:acyl-CoA reductase-like NAD-dependent aldehyde dehydrogenase
VPITDVTTLLPGELKAWLARVAKAEFTSSAIAAREAGTFDVVDPGTGLVLVSVPFSSEQEVSRAVVGARDALDDGRWSERDADERERILHTVADLVQRDFELLVTLEAVDTGKPRAEAVYDIEEVIMVLRYYAGWCTKVSGQTIAAPRRFAASTLRGPVGVCAAITPWNYPLPILMYKLAPALAFGNSFVAKPSEMAPLSAIYFVELCAEAGVPEGVLSLVLGSGRVGAALVAQPGLDKIAFTGSTSTGRAIMRAAADHPTKVSLELGGKSPQVVFASADIDSAVEGVAAGIWTNAGQVCVAGSRLLVEKSIKEDFLSKLLAYTSSHFVGHSLDQASTMGPMIDSQQLQKAQEIIQSASQAGGQVMTAGSISSDSGFFLAPTIIDGLPHTHSVHQEEIFGPALAVDTFTSEAEAIVKGNATAFGLAAGVWTGASGQGQRMARGLTSGTVWINTYGVFHPTLPFGGTKASGFGRELGESAVDAYTEVTTVVEDVSEKAGR